MVDKNNQVIRRGSYVRYEGKIYRVSYIFFKTIILDDGDKQLSLKVTTRAYPIKNLEVVNGHQYATP